MRYRDYWSPCLLKIFNKTDFHILLSYKLSTFVPSPVTLIRAILHHNLLKGDKKTTKKEHTGIELALKEIISNGVEELESVFPIDC